MKVGPDVTDKNKGKYSRTSPIYAGEVIAPAAKVTKKKTTKKKTTKKEESYGTKGHDADTGNI